MDVLFLRLLAYVMLFANLAVIHRCSKKRHSNTVTWGALAGFTLLLAVAIFFSGIELSSLNRYNGIYLLPGIYFLLPLWLLYAQPFRITVTIMVTTWTYTLLLFAIAARIGTSLPQEPKSLSVFLLFSLLLSLTLPFALMRCCDDFVYILDNVEPARQRELMGVSLLGFSLIWLLNNRFAQGTGRHLSFHLAILLISAALALVIYRLFYALVDSRQTENILREEARRDPLTGLKNRQELARDARQLIRDDVPFDLFYLDLDRFKTVNDEFGHAVGDGYLVEFVEQTRLLLWDGDEMYRLSGDEFVVLHRGGGAESLSRRIAEMQTLPLPEHVPFLGFSVGRAAYPADGDNLHDVLCKADNRMYCVKKEKRSLEDALAF